MTRTLYLLRGISGCGKSTLANNLLQLPDSVAFAADDYHTDENGNYNWKVKNVSKAHDWCKANVQDSMEDLYDNIIVHNTNTSEKEIKPYLDLADEYCYKVISLVVENRHGSNNIHNVPDETLQRQEMKLRNDIKLR